MIPLRQSCAVIEELQVLVEEEIQSSVSGNHSFAQGDGQWKKARVEVDSEVERSWTVGVQFQPELAS